MLKIKKLLSLIMIFANGSQSFSREINEKALEISISKNDQLPYDVDTFGLIKITLFTAILGKLVSVSGGKIENRLLDVARFDWKLKKYVLRIREGVRFHNGRIATAEDLEFSLVRFFLTTNRSDQIIYLRLIDGILNLKRGDKFRSGSVKGIQKLDSRTLIVSLVENNPSFLYSLSEPWISLVPIEELQNDYITWRSFPIGAGEFKIDQVNDVEKSVIIKRINQIDHHPQLIKLTQISKSNKNTAISGFTDSNPFPRGNLKFHKIDSEYVGLFGIFFNFKNELAKQKNFRLAIDHALDRKKITTAADHISEMFELLNPTQLGYLGKSTHFDLALAKNFLSKVNMSKQKILKIAIATIPKAGSKEYIYINETIKSLQKIGLTLELVQDRNLTFSPDDTLTVFRFDDRDSAFKDPMSTFNCYDKGGLCSGFFPQGHDSEFQNLLKRGRMAESIDQRYQALKDLSQYFYENKFSIPIFSRKLNYWVDWTKVSEIGLNGGVTLDLSRVKIR